MRETEVKAACSASALRELEDWLRRQGFAFAGELRQEDDYYDHPGRSFAVTDEAVRLRRESRAGSRAAALPTRAPMRRATDRAVKNWRPPWGMPP